jgi:hypothetical protein
MSASDSQQRQIELLEQIGREVSSLAKLIKDSGRVSESVVRAITNLSAGLKEHADEHYRYMRLEEKRHQAVMGGLVETMTAPPRNGSNGTSGPIPIDGRAARKDPSASFSIGESRVEISEQHLKIAKERALRWALALLGMAATGFVTWLAGKFK